MISAGGDVVKGEHSYTVLVQPLWRIIWRFLKDLQIELPYDPAVPLLGIYQKAGEHSVGKVLAHLFSLQHYSRLLRHGTNPNVHRQMNGLKNCGTYTPWNTIPP